MKTFKKTSLPKQLNYQGQIFEMNASLTYHYNGIKKPDTKRKTVAVHVLSTNLKNRMDFHGKPYQPTKWIFTARE